MQFNIYEPVTSDIYATAGAAGVGPTKAARYEGIVRRIRPVVFEAFFADSDYNSDLSAAANIIRLLHDLHITSISTISERDGEIYDLAYRMHKSFIDVVRKLALESDEWLFVASAREHLAAASLEVLENINTEPSRRTQECTVELF